MPFKKGDLVAQKVEVIQGPVIDVRYDADAGTFMYLVLSGAGEGATQRWFDEAHIQAVEAAQ